MDPTSTNKWCCLNSLKDCDNIVNTSHEKFSIMKHILIISIDLLFYLTLSFLSFSERKGFSESKVNPVLYCFYNSTKVYAFIASHSLHTSNYSYNVYSPTMQHFLFNLQNNLSHQKTLSTFLNYLPK